MTGDPAWMQVLLQMVHGPERTLRGVITSRDGAGESSRRVNWAVVGRENIPVFTGDPGTHSHRVWRDGAHLRVERPDGSPVLIADTKRGWGFDGSNPNPRVAARCNVRAQVAGTHLLVRREAQQWLGDDFTRPTGPCGRTTFLGRQAWTVELAPPARKPHPAQLVIDTDTGVVLQWRVDAVGAVAEWTEIAVGEPVDPELFTWSGPVRTPDEEHEKNAARQDTTRDAHRRWFAEHVAPGALSVEVTLDVTVQYLRTYDSRTGAFDAALGGGVAVLARRPQSTEPWDRQWQGDQHTWTANGFDWAVMIGSRTLAPDQLAALQRKLGAIPD